MSIFVSAQMVHAACKNYFSKDENPAPVTLPKLSKLIAEYAEASRDLDLAIDDRYKASGKIRSLNMEIDEIDKPPNSSMGLELESYYYDILAQSADDSTPVAPDTKSDPKPLNKKEKAKSEKKAQEDLARKNDLRGKIKELEANLDIIIARQAQAEARVKAATTQAVKTLRRAIELEFEKGSPAAVIFRDHLNYLSLRSLNKDRIVSLVLNPDEKSRENAVKFAQDLKKKGYLVTANVDSKFGQELQDKLGSSLIAITSAGDLNSDLYAISNPYMRMQAFSHAKYIFTDSRSPEAVGLEIEGHSKGILRSDGKPIPTLLEDWAKALPSHLSYIGIKFTPPYALEITDGLIDLQYSDTKLPVFSRAPTPLFTKFSWRDFSLRQLMDIYSIATETLSGSADLAPYKGVAVFGSSGVVHPFAKKTEKLIQGLSKRGVAIVTGGAGGMMALANEAAYKAGGPSIGIPITGPATLNFEKRVHSEFHSLTVPSSGYESRIPLLLEPSPVILFVPGGSGTMRELAVTLFKMSQAPDSVRRVLLFDQEYYRGLATFLGNTDLEKSMLQKFVLIEEPHEVENIVIEEIKNRNLTLHPPRK